MFPQPQQPNQKPTKRFAIAAVLAAGVAIGASGAKITWPSANAAAGEMWQTQAAPPPQMSRDLNFDSLNRAFTNLAEHASPAVVNVYVTSHVKTEPSQKFRRMPQLPPGFGGDDFNFFFGNPFGNGRPQDPRGRDAQALGSGFVINTDGYIVTNAHVVRMAGPGEPSPDPNSIEVKVKFAGESEASKGHAAKVIGVDEATDVALLKLVDKKADLKAIPLGDSDKSKVGEWVVAIGNPYGHASTVTQGIVSAIGRSLEGARPDFVQTSASINPGNSGGPLINLAGEVIGINTAIDARAQGIGFAIPINTAKNVITQLMSEGRVTRGWMGIGIQDLNEEIAGYMRLQTQDGVLVKQVVDSQPAARAGMQPYDVIKRINGQEIRNTRDLYRQIDRLNVGKTAEIEVLRNNETKKLKVEIGQQPATNS